jgi:predicted component of type VI protein secretion system
LRVESGQAFWLDTSTNGSLVAGRKVMADRADLRDGTVVEVGRTALVVHLLGEETLAYLRGLGS